MGNEHHLGGCLCGAVRYRVAEIVDAGMCHCATCQKGSGSACVPWAQARRADLELLRGTPRLYPAGAHGHKWVCEQCGSSLLYALPGPESGEGPGSDGEHVLVHLGTLDQPDVIAPRVHMGVERQWRWLMVQDILPRFEGSAVPAMEGRRYWRESANPEVTRAAALSFREVTPTNLREMLLLEVTGPQRRFVAPTAFTLAQGMMQQGAWLRGIYAGDTAVGLVMITIESEDFRGLPVKGEPFVGRFLIDERYQGLGFGWRAMDMIVTEVRTWGTPKALWLSAIKGTGGPYPFYMRYGFTDTGIDEEGEWILRYDLGGEPDVGSERQS